MVEGRQGCYSFFLAAPIPFTEMKNLKQYIGIHEDEVAWVFGKGHTLADFDMSSAGKIRCAINDVVQAVPDCMYCFANDSIDDWSDMYQDSHVIFSPRRTYTDGFLKAKPSPRGEHILFDDDHDHGQLAEEWITREVLSDKLVMRHGTLNSALQILWIMGIRKIVCVGIDGGQSHSRGWQWRTRLRNEHYRDYNRIRNEFIQAADWLGIELQFSGLNGRNEVMTDGKISVKIKADCFFGDIAATQGSVHKVTPDIAQQLFGCGKAIPFRETTVVTEEARLDRPPPRQAAKKTTKTTAAKK